MQTNMENVQLSLPNIDMDFLRAISKKMGCGTGVERISQVIPCMESWIENKVNHKEKTISEWSGIVFLDERPKLDENLNYMPKGVAFDGRIFLLLQLEGW